jgi:hypothetical protein
MQPKSRPSVFHKIEAAIRGAVIYKYNFKILERLCTQTFQATIKVGCTIPGYDDDGNE